ncbi:AEC family transporter [Ideonella sp. A 288]|uniref:AEC family transporter n=1 Tax=Ideonella sp. A 288 TaxID=1962181 RepID=UPI000B4A5ECF|nr:AEC family transporter [Ideonella sp. A 288]
MLDTLAVIAPIFLVIGLGFCAVRWGWFAAAGLPALGGFVIRFSLPALLFNALARRSFAEVMNPNYLAAYAAGSLLAMGAGLAWALGWKRLPLPAAAIASMGMCCANTAFVGFPVALQVVGPEASVALALSMMVENLLMIPLCLALADTGSGHDGGGGRRFWSAFGKALAGLPRNPIIVAIAVGFMFAMLQWRLPAPVARTVDMLAAASAAAALFYVGGMLAGLSLRSMAADAAAVSVGKLVLHPLATAGALWTFGPVSPGLATAAVLMAGAPMLGVYAIFGQKHGQQHACAARMLVATTASFVTLALLIGLLRQAAPAG